MSMDEAFVNRLVEEAGELAGDNLHLGTLEKAVETASRRYQRQALQKLVQTVARNYPAKCPRCGRLMRTEAWRNRTIISSMGEVPFKRAYGFCDRCESWAYPADSALGLHERAPASPRLQELCALTVLRAPAGQAQEDLRRTNGVNLDPSTLHREARRQGERALALREADVALTKTAKGLVQLDECALTPTAPFTLIIEIDAWNIRERNNWGKAEGLRRQGQDPGHWHWVYTATLFRLDQRATTESGRPVIAERGYVATRKGIDALRDQLYAEALQRGLLKAETVLVLADGAVWIWNLAADRFKDAMHRVDAYHVKGHLWTLAHELYGQGSAEAESWIRPLLRYLDRRQDGALDVIESLEALRDTVVKMTCHQREAVKRELAYFRQNKDRMDYKKGKSLGQPIGSGAVESTCAQYQRRFKITGQFWSLEGDEAFLALATLHRNRRWHQLFPYDLSS